MLRKNFICPLASGGWRSFH